MEHLKSKRILIGKNNNWSANITLEEATRLVKEGAAVLSKTNEQIYKMLFEEQDLTQHVLERDQQKCRICLQSATGIRWLRKEADGGYLSPQNMIATCDLCKGKGLDTESTKQYFDINKQTVDPKKIQKKCVLCEKEKDINEYNLNDACKYKSFCKTCEDEHQNDGVVTIYGYHDKPIRKISTNKAKNMIQKGMARYMGSKNKIKLNSNITAVFCDIHEHIRQIFKVHKGIIIVSKSGKWSAEATKEEAAALLEDSIAEYQGEGVLRMVINIEEFKDQVVKRDKGICMFCKGRATGVYSTSEVRTLQNSVCACIACEYERDMEKFLKWINIKEEKQMLSSIISRRSLPKTSILFEKNKIRKYKIREDIANRLVKEDMAEKIDEGKIQIKYDVKEFRNYILERDGRVCFYCNRRGNTVDHILAKAKGGLTTPKNCVCACDTCNEKKGSMHKRHFMKMIKKDTKKAAQ